MTVTTSQIEMEHDSLDMATCKSTIPTEYLLPSYTIAYVIGNGELAAFLIAWNLIMEYIVIVAVISKALIIFIDALFFSSVGHLTQIIPMVWHFSQYFDVMAMMVPIVIGGKLLQIESTTFKCDNSIF